MRVPTSAMGRLLARLAMFAVACVGWILFRSPDVASATEVFASFARPPRPSGDIPIGAALALTAGVLAHVPTADLANRLRGVFVRLPALLQGASYAVLFGLVLTLATLEVPFIYFQF